MTLVMKFGGTSVGSVTAMRETAVLIKQCQQQWGQLVVIASAMGSKPVKVTDLLLNGAHAAAAGDNTVYPQILETVRDIHAAAIDELLAESDEREAILAENGRFIERYGDICQAVYFLGELTPRALDAIGGMGEQMSVRILAAYLRRVGILAQAIDATELILTDSNFQAAIPQIGGTKKQVEGKIRPLLAKGIIPVVTGFIGANEQGVTTTLGRGGSDYSAAILGEALRAQEVWIWTDVDGVMSADPRSVPTARSIPKLAYREVSELAFYGARVLHPKTMRPCVENGIPLRIKNTFNPQHTGTVIERYSPNGHQGIKAVTAVNDLSLVTVAGKGMLGVPGIAARTFGAVAKGNVSVLLISQASSEQSICFATTGDKSAEVVAALEEEFAEELARRDIDRIWSKDDVSIVTAVGAGMQGMPGVAGRLFSALGNNGINIVAIAQGSSECSISLVVDGGEVKTAVLQIHELIVPTSSR